MVAINLSKLFNDVKKHQLSLLTILIIFFGLVQLIPKANSDYISPWDEMYHFSYVQYVSDGHIPRFGDEMNTWSKNHFSCMPVWPFGMTTQVPCGEISNGANYPEGGTNTAAIWPPVYYAFIALIVKIFSFTGTDLLFISRYGSALIWTIGVSLIIFNLYKLSKNFLPVLSLGLVLVSLPVTIFHSVFVTPHSAIPLIVGGVITFYRKDIHSVESRFRQNFYWLLFAVLALMTVPQTLPLVIGAKLATWINSLSLNFRRTSELNLKSNLINSVKNLSFATFIIGTALLPFMWAKIQTRRSVAWSSGVDASQGQTAISPPFTWNDLLGSIFRFIPNSINTYEFQNLPMSVISNFWAYIVVGVAFSAIFYSTVRAVQLYALFITILGIIFSAYLEYTIDVAISPRYGIAVCFGLLSLLGVLKINKIGSALLFAAASTTYLYMLTIMPFTN